MEFRRKTQGTSKVSIMFYFFKLHTGHRGICYITDSLFCRLRSSLVISGLVGFLKSALPTRPLMTKDDLNLQNRESVM